MTTVTMLEPTPVADLAAGIHPGVLRLIDSHPKDVVDAPNWRFVFDVNEQMVSGLVSKQLKPGNKLDKWLQAFNIYLKPGQTFQMADLYNKPVYVNLKPSVKNDRTYYNVTEVYTVPPTKAAPKSVVSASAPVITVPAQSPTPPVVASLPPVQTDMPPVAAQPTTVAATAPEVKEPAAPKVAASNPLDGMDLRQAIDF